MVDSANLWDPKKKLDYQFIDNQVSEYFNFGGVGVNYYKYLGVYDQGENGDATQPSTAKSKRKGIKQIQDLFFQENRDRHYDINPYEVKMVYNMNDTEFDVRSFGMFIQADTIYVFVHMNDLAKMIGRRPIIGDVIEMSHLREDIYLDEDTDYATNKFYVIDDVNRAAAGFSPVWRAHIFRLKLKPMKDSQEFNDILSIEDEKSGLKIKDLISDFNVRTELTNDSLEQAVFNVPYRNFETYHIYVFDSEDTGLDYPWVWAGDGIPPNGGKLAGKGKSLPKTAKKGDWFLNTSLNPNVLFKYDGVSWKPREVDFRMKWEAATRILHSFINNDNVTKLDDGCIDEKQPIYKLVRPRGRN